MHVKEDLNIHDIFPFSKTFISLHDWHISHMNTTTHMLCALKKDSVCVLEKETVHKLIYKIQ